MEKYSVTSIDPVTVGVTLSPCTPAILCLIREEIGVNLKVVTTVLVLNVFLVYKYKVN